MTDRTREELARELAQVKLALDNIHEHRDVLPHEQFQAVVKALEARYEALEAQILSLSGKGAIAAGSGAVAAGERGVVVVGDVVSSIHIGPAPSDSRDALRMYLRLLAQDVARLALRGLDIGSSDPTGRKNLSLSAVYVSLLTTSVVRSHSKLHNDEDGPAFDEETRQLTALEAVISNPRTIILGAPGSGKSTFINYLAFCLASHQLDPGASWLERLNWLGSRGVPIPIPIRLRDFANSIPKQHHRAEPHHLWDCITAQLAMRNVTFAAEVLQHALEQGQAIIFLDGLDEVPTYAMRRFTCEAVRAFTARYPGNRYVVTCRTLSDRDPAGQLQSFQQFCLAPFGEQQIDAFIAAWYGELARIGSIRPEAVEGVTRHLRAAVRSPDLWQLASNPLLLTVMALVHTHKGQLPEARALLYEETVDILLWRWEQLKASWENEAPLLRHLLAQAYCSNVDLKRALWWLAFEAHRQGGAADAKAVADIGKSRLYKTLVELHPDRSLDWARQVVEVMELRAGLLIERAPEVYTFPHRTFQEYLAGAHLSTRPDFAQQAARLVKEGALWRDVVLLAVGRLVYLNGDTDKPLVLVAELCPPQPSDTDVAWRLAWLAGDVLLEMGLNRVRDSALGRELAESVCQRLAGLLHAGRLSPAERAAAGDTLARLGDPRFRADAWYLPDEPLLGFVEIPVEPFLMGSDTTKDPFAYDNEQPQHKVTVPGFKISRYPVTNAQYAKFIEAGGYAVQGYWTKEGWSWRIEMNVTQPEFWDDPQLNQPNQPAVGLSWYEAVAYCRWLTDTLRSSSIWGSNELLRLPTEAEWERAARGTDGRIWPWGDEGDPTRCNNLEANIGITAAVGLFPTSASPYGVMDMAGNVWEWTNSAVASFPYDPADGREEPETNKPRIVRGGSWRSYATQARSASRVGLIAGDRRDDVGFRVVISPAVSADYPIGMSRILIPVLDFFIAAGFEVYDSTQNEGILVPQDAHNLRRLGHQVYVRVESERVIHRDDIEAIVETIRARYDNQLSDRAAFIIVDRPPDYGARHQMCAYRLSDRFTIVPFSAPQLQQAIQTDSCSILFTEVLGDYLGDRDLYESHSPVSDVLGFFGRERILDTIRSTLENGAHVGLFGLRKMGKTSLLNRLRDQLPYPMAVLSLQDVRKPLDIYRTAIEEWGKTLSQRFPGFPVSDLNLRSGVTPSDVEAAFRSDTQTLLDLLEKRKNAPRLILCLDEIDEIVPSDGSSNEPIAGFRDLMGFLRGIATRIEALNLVVCGMRPDVNRLNYWQKQSNPVFQSFHEMFLGPFSKEENDEMVKGIGAHMGMEYNSDALERLYLESGGHPFIARQICSLAVIKARPRPYTFSLDDIVFAVKEYLHNPKTVIYTEQELWGSLHDQTEAEILMALAKRQPQTEIEMIPARLPKSKQSARRLALANLSERWLLKSDASGYFIPYDCFRRWIHLNYPGE